MKNLEKVKSITDIKNIIMAEKEKSSGNKDYLPATELVLLSEEELKLLSSNVSAESGCNPESNVSNGDDVSRFNFLLENFTALESVIYDYFQLIISGLGHLVNDSAKTNRNTKQILKELTSKLNHKCKFYVKDGALSFEFKGEETFLKSNEADILITLGAFACLRINLEYLELRNPELSGMKEILFFLYPDVMQAYDEVSKRFGFKKTVFAGFSFDSPEELFEHLQTMNLEKWNQGDVSNNYLSNNGHLN